MSVAAALRVGLRWATCAGVVLWWLWTWPDIFSWPGHPHPQQWNDSWFYAGPGARTFLRPWLTVLFWLSVGVTPLAVYTLHTLSVLCWARLGWVALGPIGVALALSVSGTNLVRSWNYTVLSEPLALSGLAWLAAETVQLRDRDTRWRRVLWCAAAMLAATRVATAPLLLPAAVAAVGWRRRLLWLLPVAVVLTAVPLWQQHRDPTHERLQAGNLALIRVGEVPELQQWMREHGMPFPIPERWNRIIYANLGQMRPDAPELVAYIEGPFYGVYQLFLLTHPEYTLRSALCLGATVRPGSLLPGQGIAACDAFWQSVNVRVGFFTCLILALLIEPWAGICLVILPVLAYHANVNEFERLNTALWAWQWIIVLLVLRAAARFIHRAVIARVPIPPDGR